jgi:putative ABC transport system permease protein
MFGGLVQDVRYAIRQLKNSPGSAAIAVVTLALGIGANTSIFSNVNALLLRPFDFPDLDRVVTVWETVQSAKSVKAAPANFRDWTEQSTSFEHLAAVQGWDANLTGEGVAERAEGYHVTPEFFPLLGIPARLGRNIGTADFQQGAAPVVVVSYGFWQKHLAGDVNVVQKSLLLNGQHFTMVGVAGEGANFPAGAEVWTPLDLNASAVADRANHFLLVLGRLKKGASLSTASADMQSVASRLERQFPATNAGHGIRVVSLVEDATAGTRQFVLVLMGAAIFVLLLACVNVANLQLARAASRQKEMAVRLGLGASRWQLIRQLLVESTMLALIGACAGVALSSWGMGLLRGDLPPFILEHVPGLKHVKLDLRVLGFTIAAAVLSGILSGLAPALRFSRSQVAGALKENARGTSAGAAAGKLRGILVTSEMALALVLLVGAGLMVKGFHNLLNVEMGFERTHVLTFRVALPESKYQSNDQIVAYYDRALRGLQGLPSVTSAAAVTSLPSGWTWNWTAYEAEGAPPAKASEMPSTVSQVVTPDFFATLRVPLLEGRLLTAADTRSSTPVAVISAAIARRAFPGQSPIGKHVTLGGRDSHEPARLVVGVVGDVRANAFDSGYDPTTYVPLTQLPPRATAFVVRTSADPRGIVTAATAELRSVDPDTPAFDVRTLEQVIADNASGVQSSARMMLIFGFVALTLAAAGIFAVMAYSVGQRTHEIGVRMALGAQRGDVLNLVVSSALIMGIIGLAIGLTLAALMARALSSALFGVVQVDAPVFVGLTLVLMTVAAIAAYIPARWATRVDPIQALRCE